MKSFLEPPQSKSLNRPAAWACLVSNLLVLPGLGSVTAGRRIGYAQMATALVGFGLTALWVFWYLLQVIESGDLPPMGGAHLWTCVLGITLFALAWSWALASSIGILRAAYSQK